jgi:hypothetical protein
MLPALCSRCPALALLLRFRFRQSKHELAVEGEVEAFGDAGVAFVVCT